MYSNERERRICPKCGIVFTQFGYHRHLAMHEAQAAALEGAANPKTLPQLKGSIHGTLVRALSFIKQAYEGQGWIIKECDIRSFGERGVARMHTEQGELRCSQEFCQRRIRFRIHRSPSDVYFIDDILMV